MYIIDYINKNFFINFNIINFDNDIIKEANNYLKYNFLKYNPSIKKWNIPYERIDEIILRFSKDNIEFNLTSSAFNEIEKKSNKKSEIKFYRDIEINYSFLKKKLFNFQKEAILWRLNRNRYLDSLDAGLGKTAINISVFSNFYYNNKIDSIFIITPIGLTYHWKKEILDFVTLFNEDDIILIDNDNKIRAFSKYTDKKIMIISNHLLPDLIYSYKKDCKKVRSYKKIRWNSIKLDIKKEWNKENIFLLIDESHMFKNLKSIRSKSLNSIKNNFEYRALLSATPWINSIEHAYNQINLIDESIINMNEIAFRLSISESIGNRFDRNSINSYNKENVKKFLDDINMVFDKKLKEDVPEMKTKKIVTPTYLEINTLQRKIYQKVIEREIYKLEQDYDNITLKLILNKMHLLCYAIDNPFLIKDLYDDEINKLLLHWTLDKDPKFIMLKSLIKNYVDELNEKVVVFGVHPKTLNMLYNEFSKYNPLIIHGSLKVKDKELDRINKMEKFNNSDENKIAFLSALTSSAGGNWHKRCRRLIVYESPDAEKYRQLIDRIHRIDSVKNAIINILVVDKTLDNVRVNRNLNRVNFNDKLGKVMNQNELSKLLRGIL